MPGWLFGRSRSRRNDHQDGNHASLLDSIVIDHQNIQLNAPGNTGTTPNVSFPRSVIHNHQGTNLHTAGLIAPVGPVPHNHQALSMPPAPVPPPIDLVPLSVNGPSLPLQPIPMQVNGQPIRPMHHLPLHGISIPPPPPVFRQRNIVHSNIMPPLNFPSSGLNNACNYSNQDNQAGPSNIEQEQLSDDRLTDEHIKAQNDCDPGFTRRDRALALSGITTIGIINQAVSSAAGASRFRVDPCVWQTAVLFFVGVVFVLFPWFSKEKGRGYWDSPIPKMGVLNISVTFINFMINFFPLLDNKITRYSLNQDPDFEGDNKEFIDSIYILGWMGCILVVVTPLFWQPVLSLLKELFIGKVNFQIREDLKEAEKQNALKDEEIKRIKEQAGLEKQVYISNYEQEKLQEKVAELKKIISKDKEKRVKLENNLKSQYRFAGQLSDQLANAEDEIVHLEDDPHHARYSHRSHHHHHGHNNAQSSEWHAVSSSVPVANSAEELESKFLKNKHKLR